MNSWKNVWSSRTSDINSDVLLKLITLDGFDSSLNSIKPEDWLEYVSRVRTTAGIKEFSSVFEIGCGSGAFLYPQLTKLGKYGGLDYSSVLIEVAKEVMPNGEFIHCAAHECDVTVKYDFLIANSVFHYFSGYEYAKFVLSLMLEKSKIGIAILEVPDADKKDASEQSRRGRLSAVEYEKQYKDLSHLYYPKSFFNQFADEHNLKCEIIDQEIKGYVQGNYRFNCFLSI